MATKLNKPVSRELQIQDMFGHKGDVIVTVTGSGVELRKKNTKRKLFLNWQELGAAATYPATAPSRHVNNPLGWLTQD